MLDTELFLNNLVQQSFHVEENFLPNEIFCLLVQLVKKNHAHGLLRLAKIGPQFSTQKNQNIRNDEIMWLDEEDNLPVQHFIHQIKLIINLVNQNLYLGIREFETHFAHYQPGSFYKKHRDQFAEKTNRKLSFVYYLNNNWNEHDGGCLQIYNNNEEILTKVLPLPNRFICFESHLLHEVLMTQKSRYSIAGWLKTHTE